MKHFIKELFYYERTIGWQYGREVHAVRVSHPRHSPSDGVGRVRGFTPDRDIGGSYSGEWAVCVCVVCVCVMCVSGGGKEWA